MNSTIVSLDVRQGNRDFAAKLMYYLAFSIYSAAYILSYTTLDNYRLTSVTQYVSIVLLIAKICFQRFSYKELAVICLFLTVGLLSWVQTDDKNFLIFFAFIAAGKNISVKKLAKIILIEEIVICLIVVIFSQIGFIENIVQIRTSETGFRMRYAMGYSHPNRFGSSILAIACAYAISKFPKFQFLDVIFYLSLSLLVTIIADSRTSALTILVVMLVSAIVSKTYITRTRFIICVSMFFIFMCIFCLSIYAMFSYDGSNYLLAKMDTFLSGRFTLSHFYFERFPLKLFGYKVSSLDNLIFGYDNIVIDNAYVKLFILYGIIPGILFITLYIWLFVHALKVNTISAVLFGAFIYACVGLTEWQTMHFAMNYALIGCSALLYQNHSDTQREKAQS